MLKSITFILCACGLLAVTPPNLLAAGMKFKSPPPTHVETIISEVMPNAITATTQTVADKGGKVLNKTSKTYSITQFTEISVNGQKATIANLKPGMKVSVTQGTDPSKAARIVANG